jgi:hypothetical protein
MLYRLGFPRFCAANTWHIYVSGFEQASCYITVNGFFANLELVEVMRDDVMDRLATHDQRTDNLIKR